MSTIKKQHYVELLRILEELIETIELMLESEQMYLLNQNKNEAIEWLSFLKEHTDKEELKSLENEIANRFFMSYDVQISETKFDDKRTALIKEYLFKSNEYLK